LPQKPREDVRFGPARPSQAGIGFELSGAAEAAGGTMNRRGKGIEATDIGRNGWLVRARRMAVRLKDDSGQALVEAALTIPVLLVVVFGIAQFGITYNNYIMLTDSVRAGARQLSVSRGAPNPCSTALARVYASATSLNPASLSVTMTVNGNSYASSCSGQGALMTGGQDVTVAASYPCSLTVLGVNFAPSCVLTSQSTVRIE